jgi:hypothetical protein
LHLTIGIRRETGCAISYRLLKINRNCYRTSRSDRLHAILVSANFLSFANHSPLSLMANQKSNVEQQAASELGTDLSDKSVSTSTERNEEHGESRKRVRTTPLETIADDSEEDEHDEPPSKINREVKSPSPIIRMTDMRYYRDAKRTLNAHKPTIHHDGEKSSEMHHEHDNPSGLTGKNVQDDSSNTDGSIRQHVDNIHPQDTTNKDSAVLSPGRNDNDNLVSNNDNRLPNETSRPVVHMDKHGQAANNIVEQLPPASLELHDTIDSLRKQLADKQYLIDELRKLKSADHYQQLDLKLPDVEMWLAEISAQLQADTVNFPDLTGYRVADKHIPHTFTYVDSMPDELLAKRTFSLLQAREETLQSICKWQSTPPQLALFPHWECIRVSLNGLIFLTPFSSWVTSSNSRTLA